MLKYRIILIVVSVVLIAVIFRLPKMVIDNEPDPEIDSGEEETTVVPDDNTMEGDDEHSMTLDEETKKELEELHDAFSANSGEIKLAYADTLASLYKSYHKFDSAARYLEYIATENPGDRQIEEAGEAYYEAFSFAMDRDRAGKLGEKARYYYEMLLKEQPDRLDLRNKVAMTYVSSANPMEGIAMLRQILEEEPDNETAINNLGILSIQSGQFERARNYFEKLISINPTHLQGQFYLGLSYYELGEKQKARKQFELVKSMEDDPAVIATAEGYLKELE